MKNNIILVVLKKELKDIFRDKKTFIVSILIPLLLFPLLFGIIGNSMNKTEKQAQNNVKIAIADDANSSLGSFLRQQKNVKVIDSKNPIEDIKNGKILLSIEIPKNFEKQINVTEEPLDITLTYDDSSQQSGIAETIISSYIDQYSKQVVAQRLQKRNIDQKILTPVTKVEKTVQKQGQGQGQLMLSLLLPLLLLIYCISGPMAPALDLGAGEKERGTLEPLLTTQAGRMSLLWGKFLAITFVGVITAASSVAGILISMKQNSAVFKGMSASGVGIDVKALAIIGILTILTTMVFGALELSISIYARSFKEAQTYVSPLTIVSLVPIYATYMLDAKGIDMVYFHIPLANITCIMKEVLAGIYNPVHLAITFAWIAVYILISILFARYMFSREEVIFRT